MESCWVSVLVLFLAWVGSVVVVFCVFYVLSLSPPVGSFVDVKLVLLGVLLLLFVLVVFLLWLVGEEKRRGDHSDLQ
jgi:hypothetical protein